MISGEVMKIHVLASGSKGNMVLISSDSGWIAVDCGISKRKIIKKLEEIHIKIEDIKCLIITHEHSDHVAGLKALMQLGHIQSIYMTEGTKEAVSKTYDIPSSKTKIMKSDDHFFIDTLKIETFLASHDAIEPVGIVMSSHEHKIVIGTDTGYVDQAYDDLLRDANVYLIEANHHPQKLLASPRPMHLKKRILGEKGHLNNDDAAMLINRLMGDHHTHWIVMHISEDCNSQRDIEKSIVERVEDLMKLKVHYASQQDIVSIEL